jgi:hypothetical protein
VYTYQRSAATGIVANIYTLYHLPTCQPYSCSRADWLQLRKLFLGYNDNDTRTGLGMASEIEKPHPLTKEQTPWKGPGPMHWDAPHTRFTGLNRVTHVWFDALLDGCTNLRILELGSADVPDTMRERHHSTMALDKYWHDGGFKMRPWPGAQTTDGWDPLF